jgi:hypothetical protein
VSKLFEEFKQPAIQTKTVQHFGGFFHKKSVPANRKNGFDTSRLPKNEETGGIFVFSGSEL